MKRGPLEPFAVSRDVLGRNRVSPVRVLNTQTGEISVERPYTHREAKDIVGVVESTKRRKHRKKLPKVVSQELAALDTRPLQETSYAVGRVRIADSLNAFNERQRQQHHN